MTHSLETALAKLPHTAEQLMVDPGVTDATGVAIYVRTPDGQEITASAGQANESTPLAADAPVAWSSCSKVLAAVAIARLVDDGAIEYETPLRSVVPEFATGGKEPATLADVLSHSVPFAGFGVRMGNPVEDAPLLKHLSHEEAFARVCAEPLATPIGNEACYTGIAGWVVIAEVISRLTGSDATSFVEEAVMRPLGITRTRLSQSADSYDTALPQAALLRSLDPLESNPSQSGFLALDPGATREAATDHWLGYTANGPVSDLGRSVASLIVDDGDPLSLLTADTIAAMTCTRRSGLPDRMYGGLDVTWAAGLCNDPLVFGAPSLNVAGHTGYRSSFVLADLDRRVAIAYVSTGMVRIMVDRMRKIALTRAVYRDLGLLSS